MTFRVISVPMLLVRVSGAIADEDDKWPRSCTHPPPWYVAYHLCTLSTKVVLTYSGAYHLPIISAHVTLTSASFRDRESLRFSNSHTAAALK